MNQAERRVFLIKSLLAENERYKGIDIPKSADEQRLLLRALFNVREPMPIDDEFLAVQDDYLKEEIAAKGITDYKSLAPVEDGIYLWQGDITTFKCGAIVNAANSALLGCFYPNHRCIDNAIHTFSGIELRAACAELMARQVKKEETGKAKITPAFNLPCDYVLHTVGPIVSGRLRDSHIKELSSCYRSCLELALKNSISSVAFCCISTGEFHFPNDIAADIAVKTVRAFREKHRGIEVIFNVFRDEDFGIYQKLLGADKKA